MKTTKNRLPDFFDFRFPVSGFQEDYQKQRSDLFAVSKYEGNVIFGFHEDYQKQRSEFFGFSVSGFWFPRRLPKIATPDCLFTFSV